MPGAVINVGLKMQKLAKICHSIASQVTVVLKNLPATSDLICGWGRFPWRRAWEPTPILLPGESRGQGSLAGYRPLSLKESDMTEATFHACHTNINKTKAGLQIYIESFCIPIKSK